MGSPVKQSGSHKKNIVVFDFDDTLIKTDTLLDFARFNGSIRFAYTMLRITPWLVMFALHKIDNQSAKEHFLTAFYGGWSHEKFVKRAHDYIGRLNKLTNPEMIAMVERYIAGGDKVVIVSASIDDWIRPWAAQYGLTVIASQLELVDGIITGKLQGKNCHGKEKVVRFLQAYPDRKSYHLTAYGDGKSDTDMFAFADAYKKIA